MASIARVFFARVATTFVILAAGFGGGLMLAKMSLEPSERRRSVADLLPPAGVVLPASFEAAKLPPALVQAVAKPETPRSLVVPGETQEAQRAAEKQKQASERMERRKAEAEERARQKRYAERKARRELLA